MRITNFLACLTFFFTSCIAILGHVPQTTVQRKILRNAEGTLQNLLTRNKNPIIGELISSAKALVIFPNLFKAAILAGGYYGQGIAVKRSEKSGKWGRPAFVKVLQASWGLQANIQNIEMVLVAFTRRGVKALYQTHYHLETGPKIKSGPTEKPLGVNLQELVRASDIYIYSYPKEVFAEISWKRTIITEDEESNKLFYQRPISQRSILFSSNLKVPENGLLFIHNLNKIAPRVKLNKNS